MLWITTIVALIGNPTEAAPQDPPSPELSKVIDYMWKGKSDKPISSSLVKNLRLESDDGGFDWRYRSFDIKDGFRFGFVVTATVKKEKILTLVLAYKLKNGFTYYVTNASGQLNYATTNVKDWKPIDPLSAAKDDFTGEKKAWIQYVQLRNTWEVYEQGITHYNNQVWKDALDEFVKATKADPENQMLCDYSQLRIWMVRSRMGEGEQALKELTTYSKGRKPPAGDDWFARVAEFVSGSLSEAELLKTAENPDAGKARHQKGTACFYIATKYLVDRNPSKARDYFAQCIELAIEGGYEHRSAKAELEALKKEK